MRGKKLIAIRLLSQFYNESERRTTDMEIANLWVGFYVQNYCINSKIIYEIRVFTIHKMNSYILETVLQST